MTLIPSKSRFDLAKNKFHESVKRSPICCSVTIESATENIGYDAIVGNTPRNKVSKSVQCLYTRNFDSYQRTKYGLSENVSGVIYLSPKLFRDAFQLTDLTPEWVKLNGKKVSVELMGETFMCEKVVLSGYIPTYKDCVAVEIRLKDDINAG
jgi:hypothetical protein